MNVQRGCMVGVYGVAQINDGTQGTLLQKVGLGDARLRGQQSLAGKGLTPNLPVSGRPLVSSI